MPDLAQDSIAKISLQPGDRLTVTAAGQATVTGAALPSGSASVTGTQTFGPYTRAAQLRVSATSGAASWSVVAVPRTSPVDVWQDPSSGALVDPTGKALPGAVSGGVNAVSGDATGATDKASIQASLDAGNFTSLSGRGVSTINAPIVLRSSSALRIPSSVALRQAAGANGTMITNAAMQRTKVPVTITWTSGRLASVAWPTPHGFAKGQAIWTMTSTPATTPAVYCGVFQIVSVTDANNFVIRLDETPGAAAAGTITACEADTNIQLDLEGLIDYNEPSNSGATGTATLAVTLGGIYGLFVPNAGIFTNTKKYCIALGAVANVRGANLHALNAGSDGLKIYGPSFGVEWDTITGNFVDDCVSVQPQEAPGYAQYDFTGGGNCRDIRIKNVRGSSSTALAVIYSSQYQRADGIVFDGVSGQAPSMVKLYTGVGYSNCVGGAVELRNLGMPSQANTPVVDCNGSQTYSSLLIDGILGDPNIAYSTTGSLVSLGSGHYGNVTVRRVVANLSAGSIVGTSTTGTYNELVVEKSNMKGASTGNVVSLGGTVTPAKTTIRDCEIATMANVFSLGSGLSTAPHLILENSRVNAQSVLNTASDANLTLKDNRYAGNANGIIRCSVAKTVRAYALGYHELTTGNWLNVSGGALVSLFGEAFVADINAIQRTSGSRVTTSVARGAIPANVPVVCDGTNWVNAVQQSFPLAFTAALSAATSGTLSSNWTLPTGTVQVTFGDGSARSVTLTNGAATATWSGAVTASNGASYLSAA